MAKKIIPIRLTASGSPHEMAAYKALIGFAGALATDLEPHKARDEIIVAYRNYAGPSGWLAAESAMAFAFRMLAALKAQGVDIGLEQK